MIITLNGNIYEVSLQQTFDLFADFIKGAQGGLVVAVGSTWPDDASHTAVENSLRALGYGSDTCTYVATDTPLTLDATALFTLIEGLDPLCIIVLDRKAADLLALAYRTELHVHTALRIFGRTVIAFDNFAAMMTTAEDKQRAWALLKKLPKLSG